MLNALKYQVNLSFPHLRLCHYNDAKVATKWKLCISTYGQNATILSHKVVHRLYNNMFRPWVLAIFRLFATYRSAIQYA